MFIETIILENSWQMALLSSPPFYTIALTLQMILATHNKKEHLFRYNIMKTLQLQKQKGKVIVLQVKSFQKTAYSRNKKESPRVTI